MNCRAAASRCAPPLNLGRGKPPLLLRPRHLRLQGMEGKRICKRKYTRVPHMSQITHQQPNYTHTHTRTIKLFRWRKDWVRNVKFAAMRKDRYGERSSGRARICAWVRRRHVFSYFVTPEVKFNFAKGLFLLTADTWCYGSTTNSLYTADRQQREGQCVCVQRFRELLQNCIWMNERRGCDNRKKYCVGH